MPRVLWVQSMDNVRDFVTDHTIEVSLNLLEERLTYHCGNMQFFLHSNPILLQGGMGVGGDGDGS